MMPPPPVRCAPAPGPASNTEEGAVITSTNTNKPFIESIHQPENDFTVH